MPDYLYTKETGEGSQSVTRSLRDRLATQHLSRQLHHNSRLRAFAAASAISTISPGNDQTRLSRGSSNKKLMQKLFRKPIRASSLQLRTQFPFQGCHATTSKSPRRLVAITCLLFRRRLEHGVFGRLDCPSGLSICFRGYSKADSDILRFNWRWQTPPHYFGLGLWTRPEVLSMLATANFGPMYRG